MENKTTYLNWNVISEYESAVLENKEKKNGKEEVVKRISRVLKEPYKIQEPTTIIIDDNLDLFGTLFKYCDTADDRIEEVVLFKNMFMVMNKTPQHTYHILLNKFTPQDLIFTDAIHFSNNIKIGICLNGFNESDLDILNNISKTHSKHVYVHIDLPAPIQNVQFDKYGTKIEWLEVEWDKNKVVSKNYKENILKLKKNCNDYNIPFSFKSWGKVENNPNPNDPTLNPRHRYYTEAGCMFDDKIYYYDPISKTKAPTISLFGNDYYVMDELDGLSTIWELKSYLPFMHDDLFQQLKEDIRQNGLNDPILYYLTENGDKLVIEGHTRLKACIELNLTSFPTKEIQESFNSLDSIKLWMLKHQFQRRNLSAVERLELAYMSKDIIERQAKENLIKAGKGTAVSNSIDTSLEIANLAGVGRTTAVNYTAVMNKAPQAVIDRLKNGDITIAAAYNKVKEKSPKSNSRISKPEIRLLQSFDEGKELLGSGAIDGIVILNNITKADALTSAQKSRFGVLLINK